MLTASEIYLVALIAIFGIPYVVWRFFKTDNYAPLFVVQIVCGVLLGPGILGKVAPSLHAEVFTSDTIKMLTGIALWAVVLFVFTAGVEIDLSSAWRYRSETVSTAALAMFVPLALGAVAAVALYPLDGWHGPNASNWQFSLAIGMSCAVTALPILMLLLEKLGILKEDLGIRCLRYASFDDIAIWVALALILLDWNRIIRQGAFIVVYLGAAWLLRRLVHRIPPSERIYVALLWLLVCAFGADWAGLHYMVGGFLAGLVLDRQWINEEGLVQFRKYVLLLMMPIFFLITGLKTDWELGGLSVIGVGVLLFMVQAFGKVLGLSLAGRLLKWPSGQGVTLGWLLQTKGLIEIIFATILMDRGVISSGMFTAILIMAILSTMATFPITRRRRLVEGHHID